MVGCCKEQSFGVEFHSGAQNSSRNEAAGKSHIPISPCTTTISWELEKEERRSLRGNRDGVCAIPLSSHSSSRAAFFSVRISQQNITQGALLPFHAWICEAMQGRIISKGYSFTFASPRQKKLCAFVEVKRPRWGSLREAVFLPGRTYCPSFGTNRSFSLCLSLSDCPLAGPRVEEMMGRRRRKEGKFYFGTSEVEG